MNLDIIYLENILKAFAKYIVGYINETDPNEKVL